MRINIKKYTISFYFNSPSRSVAKAERDSTANLFAIFLTRLWLITLLERGRYEMRQKTYVEEMEERQNKKNKRNQCGNEKSRTKNFPTNDGRKGRQE